MTGFMVQGHISHILSSFWSFELQSFCVDTTFYLENKKIYLEKSQNVHTQKFYKKQNKNMLSQNNKYIWMDGWIFAELTAHNDCTSM